MKLNISLIKKLIKNLEKNKNFQIIHSQIIINHIKIRKIDIIIIKNLNIIKEIIRLSIK